MTPAAIIHEAASRGVTLRVEGPTFYTMARVVRFARSLRLH